MRELSLRVPALLADARSRGNLYIATELCTRSNYVWLAADDPDEGERETAESIARWSHKGFHRQHYSARLARVQTALYRGDADAAWRLHAEQEAVLRRSLLTRVQVIRVEARYLRARVALAMAAPHGASRRVPVHRPRRGATHRPRTDAVVGSDCPAAERRGGVSGGTARPTRSAISTTPLDRFARADMNLYAAVTRRRIGALQDDAARARAACVRPRNGWPRSRSRIPVAMTRMLAPGFPDRP